MEGWPRGYWVRSQLLCETADKGNGKVNRYDDHQQQHIIDRRRVSANPWVAEYGECIWQFVRECTGRRHGAIIDDSAGDGDVLRRDEHPRDCVEYGIDHTASE